jgi:hypothetical protein
VSDSRTKLQSEFWVTGGEQPPVGSLKSKTPRR